VAPQRELHGLNWLFFFVADLQAGFGPFVAVYLTTHSWTQAELGLALGVGSASAMLAQVPAGVLVDALRSKAMAAAAALIGVRSECDVDGVVASTLAGTAGAVDTGVS
jgi:hypothetical protein